MEYKLKVLLCGTPDGENSNLINRFVQSKFDNSYKMTVGVDIFTKNVRIKDKSCTLNIWDVASSQRFKFIRSTFYRGASCAILVFDLTKDTTWEEIQQWYHEIKTSVGDIPVAFVANSGENNLKNNTEKRNKFRRLVESTGNLYFETNSTGNKVDDIFSTLAERTVGAFA